MTPLIWFVLMVCFVTGYDQFTTINNSSGQYYLVANTTSSYSSPNEDPDIICNHPKLCYIRGRNVQSTHITAHAATVAIDCIDCDYLEVFSDTDNFMMIYNASSHGIFHLENTTNINISYINVRYSTIYGQYAHNVNILAASNRYESKSFGNIFYLDHVSNQINFECDPTYDHCLEHSTISAANANQFNLTIRFMSRSTLGSPRHVGLSNVIIYCPYHADHVCNFDIPSFSQLNDVEVFVPEIAANNVSPLNFHFNQTEGSSASSIIIWCQENVIDSTYHSNTEIYYNSDRNNLECSNITSECCYINNYVYTESIVCPDDDTCFVNCSVMDCTNNNIYSSNTTKSLNVICESMMCYDTIIYCPTQSNSTCYVSCDMDQNSCYRTVIKYNTNNKDIYLNCIHDGSCNFLQLFVGEGANNIKSMENLYVNCSHCNAASFIVNTMLEQFIIDCNQEHACNRYWIDSDQNTKIFAPLTKQIEINCDGYASCNGMDIYPKSDMLGVLTMNCADESCWSITINTPLEFELDYLSINGDPYHSMIKAKCAHSEDTAYFQCSNDVCKCDANLFCCPFSNSYGAIHYCNDGENCDIILDENSEGSIIYANNANYLSISCQGCSYVNIFASNASKVYIECIYNCSNIHLNGLFLKTFHLQCNSHCESLIFDIPNAEQVYISADYMIETEIYALKAHSVSLICSINCHDLDLAISSALLSIKCERDCGKFRFYSQNDLTNVYICDIKDVEQWTFYCRSPINGCLNNPRLNGVYCQCKLIKYNNFQLEENIIGDVIHEPFSENCRGEYWIDKSLYIRWINIVLGIIFSIVVFAVIAYWFIRYSKQLFFKWYYPRKHYENIQLINIEPPSKKLLYYIYFSDLLIWLLQIYIITILWIFYNDSKSFCNEINNANFEDNNIVCTMQSQCVRDKISKFQDEDCVINSSIFAVVFTMTISISIVVLMILMGQCSEKIHLLSHFVCIVCVLNRRLKSITYKYYLERQWFQFKGKLGKFLIIIAILRYLLFFVLTLVIGYSHIYDDLSIEWFLILPPSMLVILNEWIKIRYRRSSPYDIDGHIKHILEQIYGDHIANNIWLFLCDDYHTSDIEDSFDHFHETEMDIYGRTYKTNTKSTNFRYKK